MILLLDRLNEKFHLLESWDYVNFFKKLCNRIVSRCHSCREKFQNMTHMHVKHQRAKLEIFKRLENTNKLVMLESYSSEMLAFGNILSHQFFTPPANTDICLSVHFLTPQNIHPKCCDCRKDLWPKKN